MEQFGQYRIETLIGSGGMGEVYRAHDTRRDRTVALKLLPDVLSQDAEYQRRFRRESYAVARLREPHVIPIHDYGEIDGRLYIDMRLVDGQSLAALLAATGPLPPARAVGIVAQVADALDAAHASGLVHRDIKPSNILVTAADFVYVVDFGIAHAVGHTRSHLTMTGATVGTLDYMAPERFDNRPIDGRTDVYSLACVLYECLTARKPFLGDDLPALMYGHVYLPPPRPSETVAEVPSEIDEVVVRGMAKDPDERYATAGEMAAAARVALGLSSEPTAKLPTPIPVPVAQPDAVPAATPVPAAHAPAGARIPAGVGPRGVGDARTSGPHGPVDGGVTVAIPHAGQHPPTPPLPPAPDPAERRRRRGLVVLLAVLAVLLLVVATAGVTLLLGNQSSQPNGTPAGTAAGPTEVAVPVPPGAPGPVQSGPEPVGTSIATPTVGATIPVGPTPGYMEIAPNGRYAYIANRAAGVLTVFDTTANAVSGTIPVPEGGPQFVAFAPDGKHAYVSIFNNERTINEVGVLDTATSAFIARVPTGVRPFALDVTPDGSTVYVPNHDSGSITVIDTATNTVSTTISVAPNPHWVDVSDDGTRLYAANHESNVVTILDTATNTAITTVAVGKSPHSILSHPTQPLLYNVNYDSSSMSVTDLNTNAVIATVPTPSHPQDVSMAPDGRHGYLATVDDNAIQVFDAKTFQITARVPTGRSPTSIAVAPNGRQAYVTNLTDGTVTVLNIAGTA
jgi:serine/threonine-protein kinase